MLLQSQHLRKRGSPLAVLELYDKERKTGLFDKTNPEHIRKEELRPGHKINQL